MANAKEIKGRMGSIKDTMKITNAMYMISSSKVQKAKKVLANTEPFFYAQQTAVARLLKSRPEVSSIYFSDYEGREHKEDADKVTGYVVITGDKGLAGAYNHNILRMVQNRLEEDKNSRLFVIGEVGRHYFLSRGIVPDEEFHYTVQDPTLFRARQITGRLVELYNTYEIDEVKIFYTRMESMFKMEATDFTLLPIDRNAFPDFDEEETKYSTAFNYHPSEQAFLEHLIPSIVSGFVYGALVESFASEQNSRMMAMQSATDNAKEMLHDLEVQYNRVRQAAITKEITEVISGARSQKK